MKYYKIQVNVGLVGKDRWMDMGPSNGVTYVYNDEEVASRSARMCYPDHADKIRVVPLSQEEETSYENGKGSADLSTDK